MNTVVINYSFDVDAPVFVFDTEDDALEFIRKDFEETVGIQKRKNEANVESCINDGSYACIMFADGDTIEWKLTHITDKRKRTEHSRIRDTYFACKELLSEAPAEADNDDAEEMYADAANFVSDVNNLGYEFGRE